MKKLFSLALILILAFTALASTVAAEEAPAVEIKNIKLMSGIGSGVIDFPEFLVADDTLQGWSVEVKNNTAEEQLLTIVCCLYDANGLLKKVVTSDKNIAAGADDIIGLGTVIPVSSASGVAFSGGKAKLYFWNNVSDKVPFVGAEEFSIN